MPFTVVFIPRNSFLADFIFKEAADLALAIITTSEDRFVVHSNELNIKGKILFDFYSWVFSFKRPNPL